MFPTLPSENMVQIVNIISYIVTICSILVKVTPDPKDDSLLASVVSVLKFFSLYKEPKQ